MPEEHGIPGWTVYHAALSTKYALSKKTNIGYCPMIPATAVDFNTVYTVMKQFQNLFKSLGQDWTQMVLRTC
jgi:hypothetical protein